MCPKDRDYGAFLLVITMTKLTLAFPNLQCTGMGSGCLVSIWILTFHAVSEDLKFFVKLRITLI